MVLLIWITHVKSNSSKLDNLKEWASEVIPVKMQGFILASVTFIPPNLQTVAKIWLYK